MPGVSDGILEYDGANKANVFDSNGALVHELTLVSDNGNELGGGKPQYREVMGGIRPYAPHHARHT